jgi:hypothetical protein
MKKSLLIVALITSYVSWGQINYRPIPEINATWIQAEFLYSAYSSHEHATITSVVYTQSDTLINGTTYRKFGSHGIADWIDNFGSQQNQTTGTDNIPYPTGYFRQDTLSKKVFIWNSINQIDELLYDFGNLTIGQPYPETVTNLNYPNLRVMALDSVELMDGNYYQRWVLGTNSSDSGYVAVIEGLGGTNGFNTPIYPVFEQSSNLLCHKTVTQKKYENWINSLIPPRYSEECSQTLSIDPLVLDKMNLIVYPNPTNSSISIQTDEQIKSIEIYSLDGQLLYQQDCTNEGPEFPIDLSSFNSGSYLVKALFINDGSLIRRIQLLK